MAGLKLMRGAQEIISSRPLRIHRQPGTDVVAPAFNFRRLHQHVHGESKDYSRDCASNDAPFQAYDIDPEKTLRWKLA